MKVTFIVLYLSVLIVSTKAQDPHFSQFYVNSIYLNPAFAGTDYCPRFTLNYRNQWPALNDVYVTHSASYDQHLDAIVGGLGILALYDKAGDGTINSLNFSTVYAHHIPITRYFSIRAALQATFFQKFLDWNKLTFGDMIDPRYGFIYNTKEQQALNNINGLDFSSGLLAYSERFHIGFAVHHLTQPAKFFKITK